jgi:hypothetical protein
VLNDLATPFGHNSYGDILECNIPDISYNDAVRMKPFDISILVTNVQIRMAGLNNLSTIHRVAEPPLFSMEVIN